MAGIDKTYSDNYKEYKEFKDWADKECITFFNGLKECIGDWVWEYEEKDFSREIPIMNTPTWIDIYLVKNCKSKFVLDRMKAVYDSDTLDDFTAMEFPVKPLKEFKQNRTIVFQNVPKRTKYPLHSKPYGGEGWNWWLQAEDFSWGFNDETSTWAKMSMYYPTNTDTAHIKSVKGIVRHLRKQYLPVGIEFRLSGRYVGEDYLIKIKK